MAEILWHNLEFEEVAKALETNIKEGLTEEEVKARQEKFGKNRLPEEKPLSTLKIFFEQFKSPLIYILVIAGIVTLALGVYTDSIVIFGAVILNTIVGFFQEKKASEALRKLKKIVKIEAKVIREGHPKIIDSQGLVPGDIFLLSPGDKVPADGRVIESHNLETNEMVLTGEWLPTKKHSETLPKEIALADRDNIVYLGTIVENGKAKAICTETGLKTEMGKIAQIIRETREEKTPLQKKLDRFAKIVGIIIVFICLFIFVEGIIKGREFIEMFTASVAVAVAAIPEGLPVAMTIVLALGMQRILKRKGLVRKLLAAETLGSTSIICTDKTATLTEGKMKVVEVLTPYQIFSKHSAKNLIEGKENKDHLLVLKIVTLCNEAFIENPQEAMEKWIARGRPTDRALLLSGIEAGIDKRELEKKFQKIDEIPFDPIHKYIANLYKLNKKKFSLFISGAPEKILELSSDLVMEGEEKKLNPTLRKKIESKLEELTEKGLRVVAVAYRNYEKKLLKYEKLEKLCNNLVFVGLIGLKDPLRAGAKEAIKVCRQAGMRPILVTGDHKLTAKVIAKEIGLKIKKENIIEGRDLDLLSEGDFLKRLKEIEIYARVEPRHKMRIISAWQKVGEVVAMTGDGINDAPALKKADIGIALGSGTDIAKEVSDLILLPDSFNIILAAVEEGRAIIDNIRKVITYLLSSSFTEIILVGMSIMVGAPLPITAAQILWVNLIEDGLPDIALAFEPREKDLMQRRAEAHDVPLLTREMRAIIFIIGLFTNIFLLSLFFWLLRYSRYDISHIRSIIFAGLAFGSVCYVFSCKSLRKNLWQINPFSNKFLVFSWIFGIMALLLALHFPPLQTLLKTVPLNFSDWQLILGLGLLNIILIETTKWYFIVKAPNSKQKTTNKPQ